MVLISLFLLSAVFLFVKIEPITFAAVLLGLCYLPGLCLIVFGKKGNVQFEDLVLAFPFSVGISSALTIVLLLFGVNVKHIPLVILSGSGLAILASVMTKTWKGMRSKIEINRKEVAFCLFALTLTLLVSIPFFIGPNRGPIASHAFHHSSFVSQILHGIFPPENPGLGGTRIGYYWGFHSFIAALTSQTDFHQLQIIFTLNAVSLFAIFCIAYSFAKVFDMAEGYRYILPLAIIGIMRADAGFYIIYKIITGSFIPLENLASQYEYLLPNNVISIWMGGLPWLDTRLLYLSKFYNISAMPLAITLCLSYLLLLLLLLKDSFQYQKIYAAGIGITVMACILFYPPLAIFPLLHGPVWAFYLFLSNRGNFKEKITETSRVVLPYITGVLFVLPYLLFIVASRKVSSGSQGELVSLSFYAQSIKNMIVFLIPFPVIAAGLWLTIKKSKYSRVLSFLIVGVGLCLFLTLATRWPFDNSYKFNYILGFYFAFLFVFALWKLVSQLSSRLARGLIHAGVIIIMLSSPLSVETAYITSCLSMDYHFRYSTGHILYNLDNDKNEAYAWIRDNTPPDSLIIMSYYDTPVPYSGLNPNYEVAAISERNLYVIKDTDYTTSNPEYARRVAMRERLFESPEDPEVRTFFAALKRPVYLLIEKDLPDRFLVEERFKDFPDNPGRPFMLVFQNKRQRVYLIRTSEL